MSRTSIPLSVLLQRCGTTRTLQHCELCASISARVGHRSPADIPRNRILRDASSLGSVKAGILLGGTLLLLHHRLERLVKKKKSDNTNFKIKSSILYICNVNIIYFLLCCVLWELYPNGWKESYILSKVLKSVALYFCFF